MYIKNFIDKMREIECLKKYIFNQEEEKLFTFGVKPIFNTKNIKSKKKEKEIEIESKKENTDLYLELEINQIYNKYIESDYKNFKLIELIKENFELLNDDVEIKCENSIK